MLWVLSVAWALLAVSCAQPAQLPAPTETTAVETATTTTATTTTTSTTTTTTTAPTGTTTTTLPGEPLDIGWPAAGDVLGVVGVEHDDVLNVRRAPGTDREIVATLDPTADDVVATGRVRSLLRSIWYEVEVGGTVGWASASFLAYLGSTDDATSEIVDALGEIPRAETMVDLGAVVAEMMAFDEPPTRITVTVAPTVGDLGEVTYDVVGFPDDAVLGARLHVFGQPTADGEEFSLQAVERTWLCRRGVTPDGLCV